MTQTGYAIHKSMNAVWQLRTCFATLPNPYWASDMNETIVRNVEYTFNRITIL